MQLKTSEFQALFNDGLNGLAGEVPPGYPISDVSQRQSV